MDKLPKYNPLLCNNRNNLVKIVRTKDFEKTFQDFDPKELDIPGRFHELINLYANVLSKEISEHLGMKVSPFVRQNIHRNEKYIKSGYFDLHFIRGRRNFWTKYNSDCIVASDIVVTHNIITANTVIFDSYEQIYDTPLKESEDNTYHDPFYNAITSVSNSFADKANLKHNLTYDIPGDPTPLKNGGECPMSYKVYYSSKKSK